MSLINFDKAIKGIQVSEERPITAIKGELSYLKEGSPWLTPLNTARAYTCLGIGKIITNLHRWDISSDFADGWGIVRRVKPCL